MGIFIGIIIVIGIVAGIMSRSRPSVTPNEFIKNGAQSQNRKFGAEHYESVPNEIKYLIENEKSFELAEILVKIEIDGHKQNLNVLEKSIKYGNPALISKVEKIRQDLRYRNHLK